jgi:hypothetical protein
MNDVTPNPEPPSSSARSASLAEPVSPIRGRLALRANNDLKALLLMIGLYLVAMVLPAVRMEEGLVRPYYGPVPRELPGGVVLIFACPSLPWGANVLFGIAIICLAVRWYRWAAAFGWGAVALASLAWIAVYGDPQERLMGQTDVEHLLVGAYVWIGTFFVFSLLATRLARIHRLHDVRMRQVSKNRSWDGMFLHSDDSPVPPHITDRKDVDGTKTE